MKNKLGQVIGFEKLNYIVQDRDSLKVAVESEPVRESSAGNGVKGTDPFTIFYLDAANR